MNDDDNNLLATGALFGLLRRDTDLDVEVEEDDHVTNRLVVRFPFLMSPYRLTVERIPDDDENQMELGGSAEASRLVPASKFDLMSEEMNTAAGRAALREAFDTPPSQFQDVVAERDEQSG